MNALREKIEQEIRARGPIPFSRYMEMCLYDDELGYYSRNAAQFGKAGDFYTSSDVHAVFGRLLARQFDEMWRTLGSPASIVVKELGPGRGLFAQDVMDWSEKKFPDFFSALRYLLVERSPALRQRIEATLSRHLEAGKAAISRSTFPTGSEDSQPRPAELQQNAAHGASRGSLAENEPAPQGRRKLPSVESADTPTILFANEFFDALPVEILSSQGSLRVDTRDGRLIETSATPSPEELEYLDRYSIHPEPGERVEVPLQAQQHMRVACDIDCGFFVVIDYGYTREEQLAGRHRGTLKAIRQHSVSANPYEAPGEQDITADVNFTALAAVAEKHGMHTQKLVTQSQFLLGIGEANEFADAFEDCRLPQERAKVALQLKHLVTPAGMGESFHVLVGSKGIDEEKVVKLAGLSFGTSPAPL
jgi:SAM-dependent MidA family methyltransferase